MFRRILDAIVFVFGNLFVAFSRIEIDAESCDYLAVDVNTTKIIADKANLMITSSGRLLARFDAIQSINIEHFVNGKRFEWWVLSLQLQGDQKVRIG
jgi:hypothetical protein